MRLSTVLIILRASLYYSTLPVTYSIRLIKASVADTSYPRPAENCNLADSSSINPTRADAGTAIAYCNLCLAVKASTTTVFLKED